MTGHQVIHTIHTNTEEHCTQCMEYDIDGSDVNKLMERTIDNADFGNDIQQSDGNDVHYLQRVHQSPALQSQEMGIPTKPS
eukprot:5398136-Heterocapsa_arctica.AAC.1